MKVFRKITPGANPDISIHEVLTRAGSEHVAALYGWLETPSITTEGEPARPDPAPRDAPAVPAHRHRRLGPGASSVRNLFAEADLHADEVGGDFAAEAARLGEALAETHAVLARALPGRGPPRRGGPARWPPRCTSGSTPRSTVVPELAPYAEDLRRAYDALGALDGIRVQQIHGDLHLGQTLRTIRGWKIVDFEGEPAKELAERILPDSPWRDVAGMLRSLDYAPRVVERTWGDGLDEGADQRAYRADEWSAAQPQRLPRGVRRARAHHRRAARCSPRTSPTRRSTKPSTKPATVRPGWPSRSRPWRGSERHDQHHTDREAGLHRGARPARPRRARPPARRPRPAPARGRRHRAGAASRSPPRRGHPPRAAPRPSWSTSTRASGSACCRVAEVPDYRRRGLLRRRRRTIARRPLPLPADARRGRPAPDQRGAPRAALAGARRPGAPLRRRRHRHVVRRVGAVRTGRPAQGRLQPLGRPRAPDAPARRLRRLGAVRARHRLRHVVQVRDPGRRRPVAREGRPDGLLRRAARRHLLARLRVQLHLGRRRLDDRAGRRASRSAERDVGLRDAPRLVESARQALVRRAGRRAGALPAPTWGSPTSS